MKKEMSAVEIANEIRHIFVKYNNEEMQAAQRFSDIRKVLIRYQGKQINKRFKTALEKEYPTWCVYLEYTISQVYVRVYGGDSGYKTLNDAVRFFVGYDKDLVSYDIATFDKHNQYYSSQVPERVAQRNLILSNPHRIGEVAAKIEAFNNYRKELKGLIESFPDHYDIEKLADFKDY